MAETGRSKSKSKSKGEARCRSPDPENPYRNSGAQADLGTLNLVSQRPDALRQFPQS